MLWAGEIGNGGFFKRTETQLLEETNPVGDANKTVQCVSANLNFIARTFISIT